LTDSYIYLFANVLGQSPEGNIRLCCNEMGVLTLSDFLDLTDKDMTEFSGMYTPEGEDATPKILKFRALDKIKVLRVQAWYMHHDSPDDTVWTNLNTLDYQAWTTTDRVAHAHGTAQSMTPIATSTPAATSTTTGAQNVVATTTNAGTQNAIASFQRGIKLNLSDYSKFKDDKYWHKWVDQIKSIAAMHQTIDVTVEVCEVLKSRRGQIGRCCGPIINSVTIS
jgi:hypothetical protein